MPSPHLLPESKERACPLRMHASGRQGHASPGFPTPCMLPACGFPEAAEHADRGHARRGGARDNWGPCSVRASDAPGPFREEHRIESRRSPSELQPKNERWAVGKPRSMCNGARRISGGTCCRAGPPAICMTP